MQNLQNRKFTQSYALKYFLMKYTFQFFDTLVNFFIKFIFTILINNMRGRKPFRISQIPKRRTLSSATGHDRDRYRSRSRSRTSQRSTGSKASRKSRTSESPENSPSDRGRKSRRSSPSERCSP